jgi:hypothetical protein
MTQSQAQAHEELVRRLATLMKAMRNTGTPGRDQPTYEDVAVTVLSIVNSTLSTVTPEMVEACKHAMKTHFDSLSPEDRAALPKNVHGGVRLGRELKKKYATLPRHAPRLPSHAGNGGVSFSSNARVKKHLPDITANRSERA